MVALRAYQEQAASGATAAWAAGARSLLTVAATGTGKTTTASEVARRWLANGGRRVLVMAQRRELLKQLADRMESFGVRVVRGLALHGTRPVACVASVQSVARRLETIPPDAFDLVILDEAHHAAAPQHLEVLRHFPNAKVFGMTATPDRADGASLGLAFEQCISNYGIERAIADGHLVPARGVRVEVDGLDLSKVRLKDIAAEKSSEGAYQDIQDLNLKDLGKAVIAPAAVEGIVGPLMELAGDLRTVVFAVDRRHASALADAINARRPHAARVVYGHPMKMKVRDQILRDFAAGEFQYLINVNLLIEGWDLPAIGCVALARPTTSRILVAQACGRGLRPAPGKHEALILDFTSATSKYTLIGPEDVLAGALQEPMSTHRPNRLPKDEAIVPYTPTPWTTRFKTAVVDLMRRAGHAIATGEAPAAVAKAGKRAGGAVARLLKHIISGD
jgi:superfamily II DNA or RNA helicase